MQAKLYSRSEIYRFEYDEIRWADIIFVDGKFNRCEYYRSTQKWLTLEDWDFLGKLAQEIKRINLNYDVASKQGLLKAK